jgi:hypothetical protein
MFTAPTLDCQVAAENNFSILMSYQSGPLEADKEEVETRDPNSVST